MDWAIAKRWHCRILGHCQLCRCTSSKALYMAKQPKKTALMGIENVGLIVFGEQ